MFFFKWGSLCRKLFDHHVLERCFSASPTALNSNRMAALYCVCLQESCNPLRIFPSAVFVLVVCRYWKVFSQPGFHFNRLGVVQSCYCGLFCFASDFVGRRCCELVTLDVPVEMIARGLPTHPNPQTIPQDMSKNRHTRGARIRAIREHESGRSQAEICRQLNIAAPTFYRWKKQLGMMTNSDAQRLRALEKDNKELKQMVADLLLEKRVLKVALEKKL